MAIYLGSEKIIFTESSKVDIESPYTKQIIEGTISGVYSNSRINVVGNYAFAGCFNLTSVDFPNCTSIGRSAFYSCSSLTSVNFSKCVNIENYAFGGCSKLISINFPSCTSIGFGAFAYCYSLTSVSFPSCTSIGSYGFSCCYNLLSLYLLGSSIPSLNHINAFTSTPISDYTASTGGVYGSIFVPASLYNSYIAATNWSVYSSRIVSV